MRCVMGAVAKLDQEEIHASYLIGDLLQGLARASWVGFQKSLREEDTTRDRRQRLAQLAHDRIAEVDLVVACRNVHKRLHSVFRVMTTTRVSGCSVRRTRAIAAPP